MAGQSSCRALCDIRVMSDPESMITMVLLESVAFMVAGTYVARDPKNEQPGGHDISRFSSTSSCPFANFCKLEY
jgi:hypothetical protein